MPVMIFLGGGGLQ